MGIWYLIFFITLLHTLSYALDDPRFQQHPHVQVFEKNEKNPTQLRKVFEELQNHSHEISNNNGSRKPIVMGKSMEKNIVIALWYFDFYLNLFLFHLSYIYLTALFLYLISIPYIQIHTAYIYSSRCPWGSVICQAEQDSKSTLLLRYCCRLV